MLKGWKKYLNPEFVLQNKEWRTYRKNKWMRNKFLKMFLIGFITNPEEISIKSSRKSSKSFCNNNIWCNICKINKFHLWITKTLTNSSKEHLKLVIINNKWLLIVSKSSKGLQKQIKTKSDMLLQITKGKWRISLIIVQM